MYCKCDPHRRGLCDYCRAESARYSEERLDAAARRACVLIYQYVPDSDEREAVLRGLRDASALDREQRHKKQAQKPFDCPQFGCRFAYGHVGECAARRR